MKEKATASSLYPYRMTTKENQLVRVYDRKNAGVQVQFNLTLEQAQNLKAMLEVAIEDVEHHIKSHEKVETKKT